jgi:hypothetical protein
VAAAASAEITTLPGKGALHRDASAVECQAGWGWSHSVDLEAAYITSEPNAPRWDAGVGLRRIDSDADELAVWIEPHPASSTGTVAEMLRKLEWLKAKLRLPAFAGFQALTVRAQQGGSAFRWLARTGTVRVRPGSREHRQLIKAGLGMPERRLSLP